LCERQEHVQVIALHDVRFVLQ